MEVKTVCAISRLIVGLEEFGLVHGLFEVVWHFSESGLQYRSNV